MSYQIGDAKITKITETILESFTPSALLPGLNPGWNTRGSNGSWVPTFPNATYFSSHFPETSAGRITRRNGQFRWDFI